MTHHAKVAFFVSFFVFFPAAVVKARGAWRVHFKEKKGPCVSVGL